MKQMGNMENPNTPVAPLKRALFIDRDGTILREPADEQIDSLEKFEFVPGAISALRSLTGLGFEFVLVSNQDGLGTAAFPEENFWPAHQLMINTLRGEGVTFADECIDRTFASEGADTRKPGTGMLKKYLDGSYDLAHSFVIGDRATDVALARNLGAQGILLRGPLTDETALSDPSLAAACCLVAQDWDEVARCVRKSVDPAGRRAEVHRITGETDVKVVLDLDRAGDSRVETGLHFFNHMLWQIPHHGGVSLQVEARGDLDVDEHHTIEDVGIVLGEAISRALADKAGIARYGFVLPMDDCRALCLLDFGGRTDFEWQADFRREYVGDVPTEMFRHFFQSLAVAARCNLHIAASGENEHHKIEAIFKAFARTLRSAVAQTAFPYEMPSSKGII